ncbi:MAG: hypothetical protein JWO65_1573 [Sphingomonas bacterium]|nr:hypothetical protein [Sphingomonas bacterium]
MQAQSMLSRTRISKAGFGRYLRTGVVEGPNASEDGLEVKFNPWHDPQTGRFTFGNGDGGAPRGSGGHSFTGHGSGPGGDGGAGGSWTGGGFTGGGGGSFGGAGASSTEEWGGPTRPRPGPNSSQTTAPKIVQGSSTPRALPTAQQAPAASVHKVTRNSYVYQLDDKDRTTQVTGTLTLNPAQSRSRSSQTNAGGTDRLPTDDGGHYIATRFNGPTDTFNHFTQDANFNRGGYRVLENEWAKETRQAR